MRLFFIILSLLFVFKSAYAEMNVYVLTSISSATTKQRSEVARFEEKISSLVEKSSNRIKFNIKVIHQIDAEKTWKIVQSEKTFAVLWVSHSFSQNSSSLVQIRPIIENFQKQDVSKLFYHLNDNIKFFGLVGCNNASINQAILKNNPNILETISFEEKIIGIKGFKKALKILEKFLIDQKEALAQNVSLNKEQNTNSENENYIELSIVGMFHLYGLYNEALIVEINGRVLDVVKISSDEINLKIPTNLIVNNVNNLLLSLLQNKQLPIFEVTSSDQRTWKTLKINEKSIGFNKALYISN